MKQWQKLRTMRQVPLSQQQMTNEKNDARSRMLIAGTHLFRAGGGVGWEWWGRLLGFMKE